MQATVRGHNTQAPREGADHRRLLGREDGLLLLASLALGLGAAAIFAAYRAVSATGESEAGRMGQFASNLFWPGALILLGVAAVVWFGWKANLD